MEEENGFSGGADISERPSSTQAMPAVDEGPPVESYGVLEAQAEWKKMTIGKDEDWKDLPRSVFLKRRDRLFERGFKETLERQKEVAESQSREWLQAEIERIGDRDHKEERDKLMSTLTTYFGGEKETEAAIKSARGMLERFAKPADLVFLDETKLGNDPELIQTLAKIGQILERGGKKKKK
jgi:hypothetical protein